MSTNQQIKKHGFFGTIDDWANLPHPKHKPAQWIYPQPTVEDKYKFYGNCPMNQGDRTLHPIAKQGTVTHMSKEADKEKDSGSITKTNRLLMGHKMKKKVSGRDICPCPTQFILSYLFRWLNH